MARPIEQRIAETTEKINRLEKERRDLEKSKRAARAHRLIESAATIEAEMRKAGFEDFEITTETAGEMARAWAATRPIGKHAAVGLPGDGGEDGSSLEPVRGKHVAGNQKIQSAN